MRIAVFSDVHANIIALEAVLRDIQRHNPDLILSLGDQVNLGPCPKDTMALLRAMNIPCLHGNHERYILSAMDNHPGYQGANFHALRFHARQLTRKEITLDKQMTIEGITFCHAMPDDDRFPVYEPELAIPKLSQRTFDKPTHIICGHGHNPTNITLPNLTLQSIGSVGCMDDGVPGTAPYAILTIEHGGAALRPYYAAYDAKRITERFVKSGLAEHSPIMARIACMQMLTNTDFICPFVARASQLSHERGEEVISQQTWKDADAAYPWPDGLSTAAFWHR